jgi:hypothetical protein
VVDGDERRAREGAGVAVVSDGVADAPADALPLAPPPPGDAVALGDAAEPAGERVEVSAADAPADPDAPNDPDGDGATGEEVDDPAAGEVGEGDVDTAASVEVAVADTTEPAGEGVTVGDIAAVVLDGDAAVVADVDAVAGDGDVVGPGDVVTLPEAVADGLAPVESDAEGDGVAVPAIQKGGGGRAGGDGSRPLPPWRYSLDPLVLAVVLTLPLALGVTPAEPLALAA